MLCNSSLTLQQIADQFHVSLTCISNINVGKTFFESDKNYPLRPTPTRSELNSAKFNQIVFYLQTTNLSHREISEKVGVKEYTVGTINRGENSWCPSNFIYPIRPIARSYTYQNILNPEQVQNIIHDLLFTSKTQVEIGQKYGVAKNTIGDISRGVSWKEITHQFALPIKKNKIINQEKYKTIYGIV